MGFEERAGVNLYTEDQTELYESPPVVNGRVPKNSYGNLDVYVPSMVPKGGVHILDDETSRAARLLNIDYSDALTGFEFRGRHGTAVLKGAVVAAFRDERANAEELRRTNAAVRMWKQFFLKLRIKERVDAYADDDEVLEDMESVHVEEEEEDDSEEYVDDDFGGGFIPER